jgi:TonB family protein
MAQSVSTKGESLDKVQVLALLAGDVPNSRVASLVLERGIVFEPSDRYAQLLLKAGGDEGVVKAVRIAKRAPAAKGGDNYSANGPLAKDQILELLQTGVGSDVLAQMVSTRGIDFEPFDEYLHVYEIVGAQQSLLNSLQQANHPNPPPAATVATLPSKGKGEKTAVKATSEKRLRMSGERAAARLISQQAPQYPDLAKTARIQGTVRLEAVIGEDGTIEDLKVISGHPLLIKSSMDAVEHWRYQPTLLKGKPVEVDTEIDVNYVLSR